MDLDSKIRLVKDLIKENADITIGEYEQTLGEIESIERKMSPYLLTNQGIKHYEYDFVIIDNLKGNYL